MPPAYLRGPVVDTDAGPFLPGCTGKVQQTRREARSASRRRADCSGDQGGFYACRFCGWWHTSHKTAQANRVSRGEPIAGIR